MGSKVLGRIASPAERPRGPDVQMNLVVPEDWILAGATLEIELPRNLACAACGGGGCDSCERSGAVSLRGRDDPGETVEITLQSNIVSDDVPSSRTRRIVVRIPERGGRAAPAAGPGIPRGNLLLSVRAGVAPPRGVRRLAEPSTPAEARPEAARSGPVTAAGGTPPLPAWLFLLLLAAAAGLAAALRLLRR